MRGASAFTFLLSSVAFAETPMDAGVESPPTIIVAHVLKGEGAPNPGRRPCRLSLEVTTVESKSSDIGAPTVQVGERLEVVTNCYTFTLNRQHRGGTYRFKLKRGEGGQVEAWTVGGRLREPVKGSGSKPLG